jgi:hypothetical protein
LEGDGVYMCDHSRHSTFTLLVKINFVGRSI